MAFKPGHPGKPKGSRHKLSEAFVAALYDDFVLHGVQAVKRMRADDPVAYCKVVASLMPKEVEIVRPLEGLSDDDLANAIDAYRLALAASGDLGSFDEGAEASEAGNSATRLPALH